MKTPNKSIAMMAIAGMLYIANANAQNNNEADNNTANCPDGAAQNTIAAKADRNLTLNIIVIDKKSYMNDATVKIYHENILESVLNNNVQRTMKIAFERNEHYVIEVSSPGYCTKSVMVSTAFPEHSMDNDTTIYEYRVAFSLIKSRTSADLNDFCAPPLIGIIYYNSEKNAFIGCPMKDELPNKGEIIAQIEGWLGS